MTTEERLDQLENDYKQALVAKNKEIEQLKKELEEAKKGNGNKTPEDKYAEDLLNRIAAK